LIPFEGNYSLDDNYISLTTQFQLHKINDTTAFSGSEILIAITFNIDPELTGDNYIGSTHNQMVPYFAYIKSENKFYIFGYSKKVSTGT